MKTFDIRRKDIVRFRDGLTDTDKTRITKFAKRVSKQNEMQSYATQILNVSGIERPLFKVEGCKQTQKVPTEYAIIKTLKNIFVPVQTRYLELVSRKPKHPLTSIFQDL